MARFETEIEMVRRHISEGKRHIARQRELVAEMLLLRRPTELADITLANFEALQAQHETHLERLLREDPTTCTCRRRRGR